MRIEGSTRNLQLLVQNQLEKLWLYTEKIPPCVWDMALARMEECLSIPAHKHADTQPVLFSPYHSAQFSVFLYYLANSAYLCGSEIVLPTLLYYLNKVMHSVDWFYEVCLPVTFGVEHPIGSVLGRAHYANGLFLYQGTTVGGSPDAEGIVQYPTLGENVVLFANASVLGRCKIGANVMLGAGACVVNQDVPTNSIVFGHSPQLQIHAKDEQMMRAKTGRYYLRSREYLRVDKK